MEPKVRVYLEMINETNGQWTDFSSDPLRLPVRVLEFKIKADTQREGRLANLAESRRNKLLFLNGFYLEMKVVIRHRPPIAI